MLEMTSRGECVLIWGGAGFTISGKGGSRKGGVHKKGVHRVHVNPLATGLHMCVGDDASKRYRCPLSPR